MWVTTRREEKKKNVEDSKRDWRKRSVGQNELFLVWWSIDLVLVWAVEMDLMDAGCKSLGFSVSIETDLVIVWVVEVDLISVREIDPFWTKKEANASNFKSQSALDEWLSVLLVINEQKRSGVQLPPISYLHLFWNAHPNKSQAGEIVERRPSTGTGLTRRGP